MREDGPATNQPSIAGTLLAARDALLRSPPEGVSKREIQRWWNDNAARLAREAHDLHRAGRPLRETFTELAAPQAGQRKSSAPWSDADRSRLAAVRAMLDRAAEVFEEQETFDAWLRWRDGRPFDSEDDDDELEWTLADLVAVPIELPGLGALSHVEQEDVAAVAIALAGQQRGAWMLEDYFREGLGHTRDGSALAPWAAEAVFLDALSGDKRARLVAVGPDDASTFIATHHSHLPRANHRGLLYALGVRRGGRLVCVGTVSTPTGRWEQPAAVVELTRVASDGTVRGAASMLVSRVIDALPLVAPRGSTTADPVLVTYSLGSEEAAVYRALRDKGLRPTKRVRGRRPAGARKQSDDSLARVDKVRWEAGPGAAPADWTLLEAA